MTEIKQFNTKMKKKAAKSNFSFPPRRGGYQSVHYFVLSALVLTPKLFLDKFPIED